VARGSPGAAGEGPLEAAKIVPAKPAQVEQPSAPARGRDTVEGGIMLVGAAAEPTDPPPALSDPSLRAPTDSTTMPLYATLITPDGRNPTLRAHDEIKARLITKKGAFAYCFYADGEGKISRIFPNRFQPDAMVKHNAVQLSDPGGAFTLVADMPNRTEEVRCVTAIRDLGARLPNVLGGADLAPLAVHSLDDISAMFESLGENVVETRLVATVSS
jgi:hypothetical protein